MSEGEIEIDLAEAMAAGHLALHLLQDFYSHQVAEGAIHGSVASRAFAQAGAAAAAAQPGLAAEIGLLVRAAMDRLDQEEAARFG